MVGVVDDVFNSTGNLLQPLEEQRRNKLTLKNYNPASLNVSSPLFICFCTERLPPGPVQQEGLCIRNSTTPGWSCAMQSGVVFWSGIDVCSGLKKGARWAQSRHTGQAILSFHKAILFPDWGPDCLALSETMSPIVAMTGTPPLA